MAKKKADVRHGAIQAVQSAIEQSLEDFFADLETDVARIAQKQKEALRRNKNIVQPEGKMSEIFREMALTLFKIPDAVHSSEAMHAGLLLSHVAWNRAVGERFSDKQYEDVLKVFEKSRPSMWKEFLIQDSRLMIDRLIDYKKSNYSLDSRIVVVCGMRESGIIHIEWVRASDKSEFDRLMQAVDIQSVARSAGLESVEKLLADRQDGRRTRSDKGVGMPAKYRNPIEPKQTWSGRGRKPGWVVAHLAAGGQLEELEIR
ncbi:MAG: H-NS histone family protein [Magnetococcales bacterium]|nr:H-NS histone family protein [Magnetococcales bacterium]